MATTHQISNREAIIELAQGVGEASSAIHALTVAVRHLADAMSEAGGPAVELAVVHTALERADRALTASFERAMLVLSEMAGDA